MAKSTVPVELPGPPTAELHATTKDYVDTSLETKAGVPFFGPVPSGSTTPTITHDLGTADVDVTVWRVADGIQVGVPVDRLDGNNVQLTFATAPAAGEYRVLVSAGTGASGSGDGGSGGLPAAHAFTHATAGSDPVSPGSIGASPSDHNHVGVYSPVVHNHNGLNPSGGTTNQVLTKNSGSHYDYSWQDAQGGGGSSPVKPWPPITLPDSDPINLDASTGTHFRVTVTGNRTINTPTNPTPGEIILFEITASGADCTINLSTGYGYGTDFISLAPVASGKTDYIQCIYDERVSKWQIISYVKGYN